MKREPVLIVMSIIAGLSFLFGAFVTSQESLLVTIGGYGMMVVGAITAGVQFYVRGEVTPNVSVVEHVPGFPVKGARIMAGPANDMLATGETARYLGYEPKAVTEAHALQEKLDAVQATQVVESSPEDYVGEHRPENFTAETIRTDNVVSRWCEGCGRDHFFAADGSWADHA